MSSSAEIAAARTLVAKAHRICALTGAGVSAESGIRTFRESGGLWEEHAIEDVATPEGFARDPQLVWRFYNARRRRARSAPPNDGHLALAQLERKLNERSHHVVTAGMHPHAAEPFTILTQNVDGLHQRAGSRNVIELHGSLWKVRCVGCSEITTDHPIELAFPPKCSRCKALLRPHIVWFGEALSPAVLDDAEQATRSCDLFLVVGTSGVVQPAASFPLHALARDISVIEVNTEDTVLSEQVTISLRGRAGELLPQLVK